MLAQAGYCTRPAFLIIGAQKAGTTALHSYLSYHPQLRRVSRKEIHFFDQDVAYRRGLAWYHSLFPLPHHHDPFVQLFESTPEYLYYPQCAQRIIAYNSQIKLIVLLRDPIERAFSAWNMYRSFALRQVRLLETDYDECTRGPINSLLAMEAFPVFDNMIQGEIEQVQQGSCQLEPSLVRRGIYHDQLRRYLGFLERGQLLVLASRALQDSPGAVLQRVARFLGVSESGWSQTKFPGVLVGNYDHDISAQARAVLSKFYRPHNQALYELLGQDYGWS
jgi:hypothetical protein